MSEKPRILYIEDNPDNQRLVRRILTAKGYVLDLADDGSIGLEKAHEHAPNLILMDINLPGLNGYELATKFKALPTLENVPIIAITANTGIGDRERALAAGCDGYISKPIDPRELPNQVASYLGGKVEMLTATEAPNYMREYSQQLVTRLEENIRELEVANERLRRLDRAKSDFLATISHELRTPLTVIHGYIDLMALQALGPLTSHQSEAVTLIQNNSVRLLRHINDLIFLHEVRSSQLELAETDVRLMVAQLCTEMERRAKTKQQIFKTDLGPSDESVKLSIDEYSVVNALRHLIENALMYTPAGGTISVSLLENDTMIGIRVQDTGVGIPADKHEYIFEPFVRLDDSLASVGGAGLGLTIANHVAQAHGGRIALISSPGEGSAFTFELPKAG